MSSENKVEFIHKCDGDGCESFSKFSEESEGDVYTSRSSASYPKGWVTLRGYITTLEKKTEPGGPDYDYKEIEIDMSEEESKVFCSLKCAKEFIMDKIEKELSYSNKSGDSK